MHVLIPSIFGERPAVNEEFASAADEAPAHSILLHTGRPATSDQGRPQRRAALTARGKPRWTWRTSG